MFNVSTNWSQIINDEFKKDYFKNLYSFIKEEYSKKSICPRYEDIFRCFDFFNFEDTSLVILGQDPYHIKDMADGLAFSTRLNKVPKSLLNIFKEIKNDFNTIRTNPNLKDIAKQNVLLLNTCLTVEEKNPLSHENKGWEIFTNKIISLISSKLDNVVFLLMGNNAINKESLIDKNKHFIIKTSHPSPFSYHKSLKDSKTFLKINNYLLSIKKTPIIW